MPLTDDLRRELETAAASASTTALRLVALLWSECPVEALEKAAQSEELLERLASRKNPRSPASASPLLMPQGPEADRLFWLGVVVHVTSGFEGGGERGWTHLHATATALAALAAAGELVDTATHAVARDLVDASSPATPAKRLTELSLHPLPLVTGLLVPRHDLPEASEVGMSLEGTHPLIAEKVAMRTRSALVLTKLAERDQQQDWRIQREVAGNAHTPVEILAAFAERGADTTLRALAENAALPPSLQLAVASRADPFSAQALAENPSTTAETFAALLDRAKPPRRELAGSLALTPEGARRLVASLDPKPDDAVASALAENPRCPTEILREIHERSPRWRGYVATNPGCPEDLRLGYEALAASDGSIRQGVAANPRTSPALIEQWCAEVGGGDFATRYGLAGNPAAPPALLAKLALTDVWLVASRAAKNPSCPADVFERIATKETASMRSMLFKNPACSIAILEHALRGLVADDLEDDGLVRRARSMLWVRSRSTSP